MVKKTISKPTETETHPPTIADPQSYFDRESSEPKSIVHMAVSRNHIELANWLTKKGFTFKDSEADDLFREIVLDIVQVNGIA